jgi:proteic killer suppression protein
LLALHAATELRQMTVPPGNHLEALKGTRAGQHSIRVNDQWRICFTWRDRNAYTLKSWIIIEYEKQTVEPYHAWRDSQ